MPQLSEFETRPGTPDLRRVDPQQELAWQAWLAKGRAREWKGNAGRTQALKLTLIAVIIFLAALWERPGNYQVVLNFAVAVGSFVLMVLAFRAGSFLFAGVFGLMVGLFNPAFPLATLAAEWQRGLILAAVIPLLLSVWWDAPKQAAK